MLADFFPGACSRLKIFVCHAHADRAVAEEIAQALKNDGNIVFFDKDSLPPASDYNEQIRRAIKEADRFIFLISRSSLAEGKFTLSELAFAREHWPNAQGVIFPVLIDKAAPIAEVPAYLRSVHILTIEGNAAVEVSAAIDKSRRVSGKCVLGAAALVLSAVAAAMMFVQSGGFLPQGEDLTLLKPAQVDFRPMTRPAAGDSWLNSDVALTLIPIQYSNAGGRPARVLLEKVELEMDSTKWPYRWFNEVTISPQSTEKDWLGYKIGVGVQKIEPGGTLQRETMFVRDGGTRLTWRTFLDRVFDPAISDLRVTLTSQSETTVLGNVMSRSQEIVCAVDVGAMRASLVETGFKAGQAPFPGRVSPQCK